MLRTSAACAEQRLVAALEEVRWAETRAPSPLDVVDGPPMSRDAKSESDGGAGHAQGSETSARRKDVDDRGFSGGGDGDGGDRGDVITDRGEGRVRVRPNFARAERKILQDAESADAERKYQIEYAMTHLYQDTMTGLTRATGSFGAQCDRAEATRVADSIRNNTALGEAWDVCREIIAPRENNVAVMYRQYRFTIGNDTRSDLWSYGRRDSLWESVGAGYPEGDDARVARPHVHPRTGPRTGPHARPDTRPSALSPLLVEEEAKLIDVAMTTLQNITKITAQWLAEMKQLIQVSGTRDLVDMTKSLLIDGHIEPPGRLV